MNISGAVDAATAADINAYKTLYRADLTYDNTIKQLQAEKQDHYITPPVSVGNPVGTVAYRNGMCYPLFQIKTIDDMHAKIIDDYFANFPAISSYINDTIASARETGYVETLFGRRRFLPDINSRNATVRSLAERNAVNAPIQGTSADIIKLAMINVADRLKNEGLQSRMVLQIHDELVFDTVPSEVDLLKKIVTEEMENVISLSVPLTVECNHGNNWLEAH